MLLASPRGFCAGVEMAIKALAWMVRAFDPPVYCYHEIVHNKLVVDRFKALGVVFVDDISEVPDGAAIMLSAHGSAPEVVDAARGRGSYVVDSVCPLVTKVHHEVRVRAGKGFEIVYVGHAGHEEAEGTMAVAPGAMHRVESIADVEALPRFDAPVALLAQTTLSHRDWEGVLDATRDRYPALWTAGRSDLCFATTNRQAALMAMAPRCDAIVVIGSANSSNTIALEKLARKLGAPTWRGSTTSASYRTTWPAWSGSRPARPRRRSSWPRCWSDSRRATASRRSPSPTRTSTSRPRATSATSSPVSSWRRRRCSAARWDERPAVDDRSLAASDVLAALRG